MFNPTKQEEREYLSRKRKMESFYSSTKLKGVKRMLNSDEWFEALFKRN